MTKPSKVVKPLLVKQSVRKTQPKRPRPRLDLAVAERLNRIVTKAVHERALQDKTFTDAEVVKLLDPKSLARRGQTTIDMTNVWLVDRHIAARLRRFNALEEVEAAVTLS